MIKQIFKQPGLLSEKPNSSIFPMKSDLVLVFFPTPGLFVRDALILPQSYSSEPTNFHSHRGRFFDDMYVFIPAVKLNNYKGSGLAYSANTLHFEDELIKVLADQSPAIIEHSHSLKDAYDSAE